MVQQYQVRTYYWLLIQTGTTVRWYLVPGAWSGTGTLAPRALLLYIPGTRYQVMISCCK